MASRMIGRAPCPECGFSAAHVKQSEKCTYRYCPECHAQFNTRGERQRADLMAKTRLVDTPATTPPQELPTSSASATAPTALPLALPTTTTANPTPPGPSASGTEPKPSKRRGLFV